MTDLQINEEVLTAYLRGELNAAEAAAVEAWYDASAANRRLLGEIYYILYVNDRINDTAGIDVERSLRQFKRRMHAPRRRCRRRGGDSAGRGRYHRVAFQTPCAAPDRHHPSGRTFAGGAARRHQGLAQLRQQRRVRRSVLFARTPREDGRRSLFRGAARRSGALRRLDQRTRHQGARHPLQHPQRRQRPPHHHRPARRRRQGLRFGRREGRSWSSTPGPAPCA